jgi:hypothetical protein
MAVHFQNPDHQVADGFLILGYQDFRHSCFPARAASIDG